jgi:zinc transport system ATP-binding protein
MPQETRVDPNFPASVMEVILSGFVHKMKLRPFHNKQDKAKALEIMEILKISDLKKKNFCELSGGQRQKVLLARSLCATDKLLILDEPSNNLDQKSKSEFYTILKHLNEGHHIAIIMITHDLDHSNLIGNKILKLDGKTYLFEDTKDYIKETCHVK